MTNLSEVKLFSRNVSTPDHTKGIWIRQQIDTTETQNRIMIEAWTKLFNAMKKTIVALRRNLEYNEYYSAYLLDQISEKEFEDHSNEFAISFNEYLSDDIRDEIKLLIRATGEDFSASEIADIFHIREL